MKQTKKPAATLASLADDLSDALGFVECAVLAMNADDKKVGPELLVLEHGIKALRKIQGDLERAAD